MRTKTSTWFEVKSKGQQTTEDGTEKSVIITNIFEAVSFADAETRAKKEVINIESVEAIAKAKYKEVFFSDNPKHDRYYKCKIKFITLDEMTLKVKKTTVLYLVQADSFGCARKNLDSAMEGTIAEYEVASISETQIFDIFELK